MVSKKQGTSASARSPMMLSRLDETVWALQYFINGTEFKGIDFRMSEKLCWRWRRQLIKPTELVVVFIFCF